MLASTFVADGIDAVLRPKHHAERFKNVTPLLERAGLPPVLTADATMITRVSGVVSVLSGLMLATSRRPRTAALTLAVLNLPLTLVNNPVWAASGPEQRKLYQAGLLRGVSLGGGLLLAAADLDGKPSLAWRASHALEHRSDIAQARSRMKGKYQD